MLKEGLGIQKAYIACGYTDLRMGIDGLSILVQEQFRLNPLERGSLFLFCGRKSDRIKGLFFEGDGFLLLYKRLVPGFRFQWPRTPSEAKQITTEQYQELMKGFNPLKTGLIGDANPGRIE